MLLPWLDNLFSSLDNLFSSSRNGIAAVNYLMKRFKSFISLVTDFQEKEVNKLNLVVIIIKFEKLHPTVATGSWQKMLLILHTFLCSSYFYYANLIPKIMGFVSSWIFSYNFALTTISRKFWVCNWRDVLLLEKSFHFGIWKTCKNENFWRNNFPSLHKGMCRRWK